MLAYLDDLIVLSTSFMSHLTDLREVFRQMRVYNLTVNKKKCNFFVARIKYLGHYITPEGLHVVPEKVAAIMQLPSPANLKHLVTFLQTCSWYRRFIENFSLVAEPLTRLTKKKVVWRWEKKQTEAYEILKQKLTSAPVLHQTLYNKDRCKQLCNRCRFGPGEIREEQLKDEYIRKIVTVLEDVNNHEDAAYWSNKGYIMNNGLLYRYNPNADSDEAQLIAPEHTSDDALHDLRAIVSSENFIAEITPKLLQLAEVLERAKEVQEMKEEARKIWVDKTRRQGTKYSPGDLVLVQVHAISRATQGVSAKFAPRRDGPYVITKQHGPSSYQLALPETPQTIIGLYHSSALVPCQGNVADLPKPTQPIRKRGRPRKNPRL
ncbi:unnamed protein product [Arctia plantaginis]|uniref:RNA-directed DNA polymerase n=1 Tax=Arctia plantaginis TaxID=874455 RepID=A0A8S1B3D6_ARCPL|nr:unnamed protein product [Arctia plantaginis]